LTKKDKVLGAYKLLEMAAILLVEVGYVGEAELALEVANDVDVAISNDPDISAPENQGFQRIRTMH
jgi:hypothetical protein